jgi:hypothetical protein
VKKKQQQWWRHARGETRKTTDEASSSSVTIDVGEEITVKSNEKEKVSSLGLGLVFSLYSILRPASLSVADDEEVSTDSAFLTSTTIRRLPTLKS